MDKKERHNPPLQAFREEYEGLDYTLSEIGSAKLHSSLINCGLARAFSGLLPDMT